jgi:hypothetical protein
MLCSSLKLLPRLKRRWLNIAPGLNLVELLRAPLPHNRFQILVGGRIQVAKQSQEAAAIIKEKAPTKAQKKRKESPPSSEDDLQTNNSTIPPRPKMVMRQEPIPKKLKRESELEELMADQEKKKEANKVMLWRKLQAEIAKTSGFASEFDYADCFDDIS